ncbi:MAG TPA: hypothetical protein VFC39_04155 [Acidobacteriaceae bacterium]|nr:hypothetical protein [Acidobacteriaceae bacterium]
MKLRSTVFALSLTAFAATAFAQANNFQLIKGGRTMGKASYTIDKTKDGGYKVKARFEYRTGLSSSDITADPSRPGSMPTTITDAQMSSEYKVDANGNYLSGFTQDSADQMITSLTPSKKRDLVVVGQTQGGTSLGSKSLPMPKPDFLVAPDYDPSAVQVLITAALAHPHSDHLYLLVVPGIGNKGTQAMYVNIADPADATGTLNGKPVALKQYPVGWNQTKGALYTDADGTLMQIDVGPIGASYARNGFKLDAK